jgi:hypothetical protein
MTDVTISLPAQLADFTIGLGFVLMRGESPGVAARLELDRPLDLSPQAARHLASWLAAYAEAAEG